MLSKKVGLNTVAYYSGDPHDSVIFEECPDESGGTTVMSIPFDSLKELVDEISAACDNTHDDRR